MHFPLDISENLHSKFKKKNLSNARSVAILFAVRDLNFHLIILPSLSFLNTFVNLNDNSTAILIQADTT